MKRRYIISILLGVLAMGFVGCTTSYEVRVDALSTGQGTPAGGQSYELISVTPGIEQDDLFFQEVAKSLGPVLAQNNLYPVESGKIADLQIEVNAYLSDPLTETRSYSEPVYVETGSRYRTVRVPVVNDKGEVVRYAYNTYWRPSRTYIAGWVDNNQQVTVYDKILQLSARRILNEKEVSGEIWSITVALRGESTDYRSALPYMLVAAGPYIGKRTIKEEVIVIREDAEEVKTLRAQLNNGR